MPASPTPINESDRLEALHSYNILDTAQESDFDDLTKLASAICNAPIALISFIDEKRQWFKSANGATIQESPRELSFCTHAIASVDRIMIVEDATNDDRFSNNPLLKFENIVFYAGVPLVNEDGFALGTLCIVDRQQKTLTQAQIDALQILAKQVVDKLELRRKVLLLEKTNQELQEANFFIQKFASMAAHDIKNPVSSILLTSQALKIRLQKLNDDACQRLVELNIASIKNLTTLLDEMLAYSKSPSTLLSNRQKVSLKQLLIKATKLINVPVNFSITYPDDVEIYISTVALEQIFINLLSNAIRYNDKESGFAIIRFDQDDHYYLFEVEDHGMGIPAPYHEKIFNNNFTLKQTDRYNKNGTGIGLSTVKELVKALKGTIYVKSMPGSGATFYFRIKK